MRKTYRTKRSEIKVSVIIAFPHPGCFNHAIAEKMIGAFEENWHIICFQDLYQESFDPVLPYGSSRDTALKIALADGIVSVHPDSWGMPPAILKAG